MWSMPTSLLKFKLNWQRHVKVGKPTYPRSAWRYQSACVHTWYNYKVMINYIAWICWPVFLAHGVTNMLEYIYIYIRVGSYLIFGPNTCTCKYFSEVFGIWTKYFFWNIKSIWIWTNYFYKVFEFSNTFQILFKYLKHVIRMS